MPIQVDAPINIGSKDDWGLWGDGAPATKMIALATNDGDYTVIWAASGGAWWTQLLQFPAIAGVTDPVTAASITAVTRMEMPGGGGIGFFMYWNGTSLGVNRNVDVVGFEYRPITYTAIAPHLTLASVNGEHGFLFFAAGGPQNKAEYWVTQAYRTVNYSYLVGDAGEFAYMIGSLAGAAIGGGLLFREMPGLARYIWRKARYLIKPEEYETAWRAWLDAPRRAFAGV